MVATLERKVGGAIALDEAGPGSFEGRASTFGSVDAMGDAVAKGAYQATLHDFIRSGFIAAAHDWSSPIGYVLHAEERSDGLWIRGAFHSDPESQRHRTRARERIAAGRTVGLSIGFQAKDGFRREDGVRVLTQIRLFEVSIVTMPAEPLAHISTVKHPEGITEAQRQQIRDIFTQTVVIPRLIGARR